MIYQDPKYQQAETVTIALNTNFTKGYELLLDFVNEYSDSKSLKARVVLLGADMSDLLDHAGGMQLADEKQNELLVVAQEIINEVLAEQTISELRIEELQKVRKSFIDKGRPTTVYLAERITRKLGNFILLPISLNLKLGEITSVVGQNGNGKSTLLKIIAGELATDEGQQQYPEFSRSKLDWIKIKKEIAYIPQDFREWSRVHSRREYLHFTAGVKGITGKENKEAVDYIIARLGLKKYENYSWNKLSGGYKLRFELARQLVWSPKLLIMDEPLAHLDIKTQRHFLNDLRNLTNSLKSPMAVILSSQNLYEIENISDHVVFLNQGEATYNGPVKNISQVTGHNSYLLGIVGTITQLKSALLPIVIHIKDLRVDGDEILLITTYAISSKDILTHMTKADIAVKYFRDISDSTRVLFEQYNNNNLRRQ